MYLFGLASRRSEWLANRQVVLAENVANANTPSYRAKDIAPFSDALQSTQLAMTQTSGTHMAAAGGFSVDVEDRPEIAWDVTYSGNSVSLEQEMLKAGEVSRDYSLDANIVKAFHRLYLSSVKG